MYKDYFQVICSKGHQLGFTFDSEPSDNYCEKCGSKLISSCPSCGKKISGWTEYCSDTYVDMPPTDMDIPYYCKYCSQSYPWTQEILDNSVEILALDAELSNSDKELIKNSIPDLIVKSASTPLAEARFKKGMVNAATFVKDSLRNLLIDVVSESVRKSIFPY